MNPSTAPLEAQTPRAATRFDVATLEGALARRGPKLHFETALERTYEHDTGVARTWRHIVCNLLGTASFYWLSAPDDAPHGDVGGSLMVLRPAVVVACMLAVALLWLGRRSLRGWQRETLSAGALLAVAGYASLAAHWIDNPHSMMQGGGLLLVFLHAGIAARLQFRFAVAMNLITFFGYAILAEGHGPETAPLLHNHLLLFSVVATFCTVGNGVLELRERRGYLLECLKAKRHQALLADAEALRQLTVRDSLTGLYNRRHLDAELTRRWSAANGQPEPGPIGLLQVDADHFKAYNDRHGHPAGDRCLAALAEVLEAVARRHGGLAARVGGEEFAVLLPAHDTDRATTVASELCAAVRALALPHGASSCAPNVTVSIGVAAVAPAPGAWPSTLVGAADAALYAAKERGRDRLARFEPPLAATTSPRTRTRHDAPAPEAPTPSEDDLGRIDRLSALLGRRSSGLRFPPDLETEFQERAADARRRQLAFLSAGGLAMTLIYIALSRPVVPDIVDALLSNMLVLSLVGVALAALNLKLAFGWRIREGVFAGTVAACGLAILWFVSRSTAPTVYSATLGLCLLPMFSSLVAGQPLRISLLPSVVICVGIATLMAPELPERRPDWLVVLGVVCLATTYSLIGAFLLERANRRAHLLDRLRAAQLAVLHRNTEHLQRLATLDPLTRLPNRRHFESELERLAAAGAAAQQPLALLILDIDHFKPYNDGYGHPAGDACLVRVGAALSQWARRGAPQPLGGARPVAARIGGEEFAILLPGSDAPTALAAAQRLRVLLRDLRIDHAHAPAPGFVTASVGAASLVLANAADARLLLKAADAALYRAKGAGRDRAAA